MSARIRNIFFLIGLTAIIIMLCTFDMSWSDVLHHLHYAGLWFPAVILLWVPIYMMNAWAWRVIINDGSNVKMGFWQVLKYTISGYALNYVTPVGLLGGEPYRIMELTSYVGRAKAASSVILYAMMHIFSHFWFWLFSVGVFFLRYGSQISWPLALTLAAVMLFCFAGIYFFLVGYRDGLAMRTLRLLSHLPWLGHRIARLSEEHREGIEKVDRQIAELHAQRRSTFYQSLGQSTRPNIGHSH